MALRPSALTTVGVLAEDLEIALGVEDERLERYIHTATSWIERYCHRTFHFEQGIVEMVKGYGTTNLLLRKPPIREILEVLHEGGVVTPSQYDISNAEGGIIFRRTGWPSTAARAGGDSITQDRVAGSEAPTYRVTYSGGYYTPTQAEADAAVTADLPADIEQACLILATSFYLEGGRNFRVRRAHLLEAGTWYDTAELMLTMKSLLQPHILHGGA